MGGPAACDSLGCFVLRTPGMPFHCLLWHASTASVAFRLLLGYGCCRFFLAAPFFGRAISSDYILHHFCCGALFALTLHACSQPRSLTRYSELAAFILWRVISSRFFLATTSAVSLLRLDRREDSRTFRQVFHALLLRLLCVYRHSCRTSALLPGCHDSRADKGGFMGITHRGRRR